MSDSKKLAAGLTMANVLSNIKDPRRWIKPEALIQLIIDNPSLRGFAYGYVAEHEFFRYLEQFSHTISSHFKEDDHKKTKSDCTFVCRGKTYTIQLKSLQTNSIREIKPGIFAAKIENDASDRRKVTLPNHHVLETTCYVVGEYDILGVSLQPFTGKWDFAFKKNKNLKRTTFKKYKSEDQQFLLATLEDIMFPLEESWSTDLLALIEDPDLGKPHKKK